MEAAGLPCVVTHGEPHGGNFLHTGGGLRLADWDTVALASPERDLWLFEDDGAGNWGVYVERTGYAPSRDALRL